MSTEAMEQQQQQQQPTTLLGLPRELLVEVLNRLAKQDYYSVKQLSRTCNQLRTVCKQFMETNPPEKFMPPHRVAGDSDSEDSDEWLDGDWYAAGGAINDDIDDLADEMFDRLSYGSSYDSDDHNFVYGGHNSDEEEDYDDDDGEQRQQQGKAEENGDNGTSGSSKNVPENKPDSN